MTDRRISVIVVGAGLISQAMHLPHLSRLDERFRIAALVDPSATVRERLAARYAIAHTFARHDQALNSVQADAVLIASPSASHAAITVDALQAGLHVLVEKPLCITVQDADAIIAARDRAGRVVQVAYNNRYDRAYERLLDELPEAPTGLRYVSVVIHDPELDPYFGAEDLARGSDVDPGLLAAGAADEAEQVRHAVGDGSAAAVHGFSGGFLGSLVHEINMVHGMLERMGEPLPAPVIDGDWWTAGPQLGQGLTGSARLSSGARWDNAWIQLLGMSDFDERIALYFDDEVKTLTIPSPWLRQAPSVYTSARAHDGGRATTTFESYDEAYQRELVHFHDCVTAGAVCRTPPEQARLDIEVLAQMFACHLSRSSARATPTR